MRIFPNDSINETADSFNKKPPGPPIFALPPEDSNSIAINQLKIIMKFTLLFTRNFLMEKLFALHSLTSDARSPLPYMML